MLLLARPEPISVIAEIPEGPPVRFVWRRVPRRVRRAQGPERIEPEWWRLLEAQLPGGRDPHRQRSGGAAPDQAASWLGAGKTIAARDWNGLGDDSKASAELAASGDAAARTDIPEREAGGRAIWTLNLGVGAARDYYRIEDEAGGRFWLFREGLYGTARAGSSETAPPSWFLHGVFG